jgi:hypothetical protein
MILIVNRENVLKQHQKPIFVTEKRCVLFAVRTELLNNILASFGFRWLIKVLNVGCTHFAVIVFTQKAENTFQT